VQLGLSAWLWPFEAALLASLALLFTDLEKYKLVEGVATLSLLIHIWAIALHFLFTGKGIMAVTGVLS
jgi:hypothetical protein